MSDGDGGWRPVKSTERTLAVLEHLAVAEEPVTLSRMARDLGVPKSSLHAILRTMQRRGWVETDPTGSTFGLGVRATLAGASYVDSDDVVGVAGDALDWLVESLGETVHLGRLDGADIVYLAKRECAHPLRMFSAVGRRLPAYSTALGKALLAGLPADRLDAHLPATLEALTGRTVTDRYTLGAELRATGQRGYARDDEENSEGIRCLAVPLGTADPPEDALSCSIPVVRFDEARVDEVVAALREAARWIERRLGARGRG